MTRSKFGPLCLCAVVFGLMAFGATAAQAEAGAQWLFSNSEGSVAFLEASVQFEIDQKVVLHTKVSGVSVLLLCSSIATENATLTSNGGLAKGAKIKLSSCTFDLNGVTSSACEPTSGGTEKGVIRTTAVHGLIVLHKTESGTTGLLSILPDSGETLFTSEMGKECSIGTKIPLIGKFTIKDCEALGGTHLVKHLIEVGTSAELTELWMISKTAEHATAVLGGAWASLSGAHMGLKFGGDAA